MHVVSSYAKFIPAFALSVLSLAPEQSVPNKWSDRGVFVFGPLLIDFAANKGTEVLQGSYRYQIVDCSNASFYCASGHYVKIALPKVCQQEVRTGTVWAVGNVTTTVLYRGRSSPPIEKVITETFLLGSKNTPNVVWTYRNDAGVTGLYIDSSNKTDLVSVALEKGVDGLNNGLHKTHRFYERLTSDAFGSCKDS